MWFNFCSTNKIMYIYRFLLFLIGDLFQPMINLAKGFPAFDLLPTKFLEKSSQETSKRLSESQSFAGETLHYVDNLGNPFLRTALAKRLSKKDYQASPDHICLTHGAT
jgi:DNA-binding transcriptional MocR family regulator